MTLGLVALTLAGIVLPHVLDLRHARPAAAAAIWISALGLRALLVLVAALSAAVLLPRTDLFAAVTHWCWHLLPVFGLDAGIDGHRLGDLATVVPAITIAASAVCVAVVIVRAARAVRRLIVGSAVASGPADTLIVGGADVVLAATGLAHPRVVVSAGALTSLDDDELAASLDHERGHIAHRHRFVLLFAELCRALARFLPGTTRAVHQVRLHLERDADRWALRRRHHPEALARAICKAATSLSEPGPCLHRIAGAGVARRVDELTDAAAGRGALRATGVHATAVVMACLTVALAAILPAHALGEMPAGTTLRHEHGAAHYHCEHAGAAGSNVSGPRGPTLTPPRDDVVEAAGGNAARGADHDDVPPTASPVRRLRSSLVEAVAARAARRDRIAAARAAIAHASTPISTTCAAWRSPGAARFRPCRQEVRT